MGKKWTFGALVLALGCNVGQDDRYDGFGPMPGDDGGDATGGGSDDDTAGGDGGQSGGGDDGNTDDDGGGDAKFDVAGGGTGGPGDMDDGEACDKVDFLFLVDGSGSMSDNQENLIANFPGFIDAIEEELETNDYRIMVIDPDAGGMLVTGETGDISCFPEPQCCTNTCNERPLGSCWGDPCPNPKGYTACDFELGGGKVRDQDGNECGFVGSNRWMTAAEPDLSAAFECAARVRGGDDEELQIQAILDSVTDENDPGGCNEGFIRDDALLVVVMLTDEEDGERDAGINPYGSAGTPAQWKQTLMSAKNGDETAVVVLALIGDQHVPNPVCLPPGGVNPGMKGEASPILEEFAESFPYGKWGSVCELDYKQFFVDAISVVDTACDEFMPPG